MEFCIFFLLCLLINIWLYYQKNTTLETQYIHLSSTKFCGSLYQPPDDGWYRAEKLCRRGLNCISKCCVHSDNNIRCQWNVSKSLSTGSQTTVLRMTSSKLTAKTQTFDELRSVLLCRPIPKSDCQCTTLQDISPVPPTPRNNIKAPTTDLQCHLPIWRCYSPLSGHFQKCCQSWRSEVLQQPPCSPDISPCDCYMTPQTEWVLAMENNLQREKGDSNSSSVGGGTD